MDAVEGGEAEAEVVFRAGDDFETAPAAVQMWLLLDFIERIAHSEHPALTSLLQYQVIGVAQQRKLIYQWQGNELIKVNNGDEFVEDVESVAGRDGRQESDEG